MMLKRVDIRILFLPTYLPYLVHLVTYDAIQRSSSTHDTYFVLLLSFVTSFPFMVCISLVLGVWAF